MRVQCKVRVSSEGLRGVCASRVCELSVVGC